jgi:hypothetical protein
MNCTANRAVFAIAWHCRAFAACYFEIAAGPLAVFSKRFVFELIEDENG